MKTFFLLISLLFFHLIHAQNVNALISKGNQYYKQTQFDLAEAEFRKALTQSPNNAIAQYNLANALQKQKKYDESVRILENLYNSSSAPGLRAASVYNQGVAHTKQKALEASIESYKKALRLEPGDQQARENLQKALAELKKKQEEEQKQQQKQQSSMSQREAEQKLRLLHEKEKKLQQRLQNQKSQKGGGQTKDW